MFGVICGSSVPQGMALINVGRASRGTPLRAYEVQRLQRRVWDYSIRLVFLEATYLLEGIFVRLLVICSARGKCQPSFRISTTIFRYDFFA